MASSSRTVRGSRPRSCARRPPAAPSCARSPLRAPGRARPRPRGAHWRRRCVRAGRRPGGSPRPSRTGRAPAGPDPPAAGRARQPPRPASHYGRWRSDSAADLLILRTLHDHVRPRRQDNPRHPPASSHHRPRGRRGWDRRVQHRAVPQLGATPASWTGVGSTSRRGDEAGARRRGNGHRRLPGRPSDVEE